MQSMNTPRTGAASIWYLAKREGDKDALPKSRERPNTFLIRQTPEKDQLKKITPNPLSAKNFGRATPKAHLK